MVDQARPELLLPTNDDLLEALVLLKESGFSADAPGHGLSRSDALLLQEMIDGIDDVASALDVEIRLPAWVGDTPMGFEQFSLAVDGVPLSERQVGAIHRMGITTASGLFSKSRTIHEGFLKWGKGSGKDWISARFCAWVSYVLLNMVSPKEWLRPDVNISENERIDILNVAPKGDLAKQVYFEYLRRVCLSDVMSPWITRPRDQVLTERIVFPQLNLNLVSLNSSARGMDGYSPLVWVMDEADAFMDTADKSNGDQVHKILRSSATTRWRGSWIGLVLSYMRSGDGFMHRTVERIKGEIETLAYHLRVSAVDEAASWEVNPNISRDDPVIVADYRNDPTTAAAMYEGIAPPVEGGFFEIWQLVDAAVGSHHPVIVGRESLPDEYIYLNMNGVEVPSFGYVIESIRRDPGREYFLGIDGGEKNDSFVLSAMSRANPQSLGPDILCPLCRVNGYTPVVERIGSGGTQYMTADGVEYVTPGKGEYDANTIRCSACMRQPYDFIDRRHSQDAAMAKWLIRRPGIEEEAEDMIMNGHRLSFPRIREEGLIRVKPRKGTSDKPIGVVVNFPLMEEVAYQIMMALQPRYTRMDPWQTTQMRQSIASRTGQDVGSVSFSNTEQMHRAILCKALAYNGRLSLLPGTGSVDEWKRLIRKGPKLDHPSDGSKDMFDAQSIAIWLTLCASFGTFDLQYLTTVTPTRPE